MNKNVNTLVTYINKHNDRNRLNNVYNENGYNYAFNDYMLLRTIQDVEGCTVGNHIDCEKLLKTQTEGKCIVVNLPNVSELKQYIKDEKAKYKELKEQNKIKGIHTEKQKPIQWDFGHEKVNINADFLLQALKVMDQPSAVMYDYQIVISDKWSTCLIMGMRKEK